MFVRLPKSALWAASVHFILVGGLATWMVVYGASLGVQREGAMPFLMLLGEVVIVVADFPALWVTMMLTKPTALPPVVTMALLVVLGTIQWLAVSLFVNKILRRIRGPKVARTANR